MKIMQQIDQQVPAFLLKPEYHLLRHMLLQLCILCITLNVFWDVPTELILTTDRFISWGSYYLAINAVVYLNTYWLAPRFLLTNRWRHYLYAVIVLILMTLLLVGVAQSLFYHTELSQEETTNGMWAINLLNILSTIFTIGLLIAGTSALLLLKDWITYNQRIEELKTATLTSELSFLKSQINPHFLFNMLNNANIMADEEPEVASGILLKLEEMLRYQMDDSAQEEVALQDDVQFLKRFLELEQIRRDQFEYTVTVEGEIANNMLPPLIFIPFVENAVKHGTDSETKSSVYIHFCLKPEQLIFTCRNSKPRIPVKKPVGGIGLANIRRRLELLYPEKHRLEISEKEIEYTVKLQLDL